MANENETTPPEFGGTNLNAVAGLQPAEIAALNGLGFFDAEQVLGALAVPGVESYVGTATNMSDETLAQVAQRLRAAVPFAAAEPFDIAPLTLGALAPTPETEQMAMQLMPAQMADARPLPSSVNHTAEMPPVRQQGSRGTCVAFAMTAVHEHFVRKTGQAAHDFSEQFLYHETKKIDGSPGVCGTWQVKAAQVLGTLGQCREQVWTYNPNPPCNNNGDEPSTALAEAQNHVLPTILLNPRNTEAIKGALADGCVVGFSIPVYDSWFKSKETVRSGRITMRAGSEPSVGGHAMCLIGYRDQANVPGGGYFILRNSWFGDWGTESPFGSGNGIIPYAYLAQENWEAVTTAPPVAAAAA